MCVRGIYLLCEVADFVQELNCAYTPLHLRILLLFYDALAISFGDPDGFGKILAIRIRIRNTDPEYPEFYFYQLSIAI